MNKNATNLTAPVFLLGSHKSGSSLLRSLLDGHPELYVIPTEIHYFQYTGYWVDYSLRRSWPREMDRSAVIESLIELVEFRNARNDPYADAALAGRFDVKRFRSFLQGAGFGTETELYTAYVRALHLSLTGHSLAPDVRVVEKSVENAENAIILRHLFPDCRFVHIVRNPYATLVSLRRSRTIDGRFPRLDSLTSSIHNCYYHLYRNERILDKYLVIQYEELVTATEQTMKRVAESLGIGYEDSLLHPTLMGQRWGGNSTSNTVFNGVSAAPVEHWKEHITNIEMWLINRMLAPAVSRLGYERLVPRKSRYLPFRGEDLRTYLANRALCLVTPRGRYGSRTIPDIE